MNINADRLAAIWCALEAVGPRRATNRAMKVKAVTSKTKVAPIGSPSLSMVSRRPRCGQLHAAKMPKRRYSASRAHQRHASRVTSQADSTDETPQPSAPSAGLPR